MSLEICDRYENPILDSMEEKNISIDNRGNSSTLTNYQVNATTIQSKSLFFENKQNLSFVDENLKILSFWTETFPTSEWVKVPTISASKRINIKMLNGGVSEINNSSGKNTYVEFNDFDDNTIGSWTSVASVSAGSQKLTTGGTGLVAGYSGNTAWTDYILEGTFSWNPGYYAGPIFRRTSDTAYYLIWPDDWNGSASLTLRITKFNPGRTDLLSGSTSISANTDYSLKAVIGGTSLKVYINGNLIINGTDATFSAGNIGAGRVVSTSANCSIDTERVREYTTPEPTISVD